MKPKHLRHISAAALFFLFSIPSAYALDCIPVASWVGPRPTFGDTFIYQGTEVYEVRDPSTVGIGQAFGQIFFQSMRPINSSYGGQAPLLNCQSKTGSVSFTGMGAPLGNDFPSGLPGIAFRIKFHTPDSNFWNDGTLLPETRNYNSLTNYPGRIQTNAVILLIKTGNVPSIGPFTGTFAVEKWNNSNQVLFEYQFSNTINIIHPIKVTCSLKPIPPVDLGTYPVTKFTGPQSTTPPQNFNVDLSCASRTPGSSINAYMTFTDNINTANTSNALTLQSSPVTGLGVQILRNGNPVRFGPQNASVGSPNVQNVGPITQPGTPGEFTYSIPLQARYVQTGNSVSGSGPANAQAMVTINYQ